uniref:GHMP kinase family protein n=1 Tax=Arundo donax TaxID=35708 RepID=A0A0A9ERN1_ARUDO
MINMSPQRANPVGTSNHPNISFIPTTNLHHLLAYNAKLLLRRPPRRASSAFSPGRHHCSARRPWLWSPRSCAS